MSLLEVRNLSIEFQTDDGALRAVDDLSFRLEEGEILGLVGESGSGKSVSCLSLLGLLPKPAARVISGEILFRGRDLLKLSERELRDLRGQDIAMIFQDPFTSLNPYLKVSTQLMEVLEAHTSIRGAAAKKKCIGMLEQLGVPDPAIRFQAYPHQLSGGLKQRIMIAMALLLEPKILIADEPTTALDVTIQAQIVDLLRDINKTHGTSLIFITHDLGVVAGLCQRVNVMYAGRLQETGTVKSIFHSPRHPYTRALLNSLPKIEAPAGARLETIPGTPPNLLNVKDFCAFHPRCKFAEADCRAHKPKWTQGVACYHPLSGAAS